MNRTEVFGEATLIHGDCRELLSAIPAAATIVADPPYGMGFRHSGNRERAPGCRPHALRVRSSIWQSTRAIVGDDAPFDPAPWLSWPCALFGADHFMRRLPEGGVLHAWDKAPHGAGPADDFADVEFLWTSWRCKPSIARVMWKGLCRIKIGEEATKQHGSQKPLAVMRWAIAKVRSATSVIVDPFMGSGSTGVACAQLGRSFLGIEIERDHFETACRRVEAAYLQPRLFPEPPAVARQEVLAL